MSKRFTDDTEMNVGLTDDEIVKALECCAVEPCEDCDNCPRFTKEKLCHKANAKQSLDLIHRLQSENAEKDKKIEYYKDREKSFVNAVEKLKKEKSELKAEIERLTEKNESLEERNRILKKYKSMWAELDTKNTELQKQTNELKEQRDVFKRLFESVNTSNFSTNSIIETMNSFYREQAEHLAELKIKKAVKDTAKEIFTDLLKEFSIRKSCGNADVVVREMAMRKGIEVE